MKLFIQALRSFAGPMGVANCKLTQKLADVVELQKRCLARQRKASFSRVKQSANFMVDSLANVGVDQEAWL